jgi:hypothetical protein
MILVKDLLMDKIQVLDCTLRDGGYINGWKFDNSQIFKVIDSLESSNVDIIECGYLDDKSGNKENSTLFDGIKSLDNILSKKKIKAQKVAMINLGDFDVVNLPNKKCTSLDGIRLAFHQKDINLALELSGKIINLGYNLYFQPMVTKNYLDRDLISLIKKANKLKIYAFYVVDSFGSMTLKEFKRYVSLFHNNLSDSIALGYHSHNNMQLAFSNAIDFCNSGIEREIILDSSIYGMGRGAGNLNTELIADYLNKSFSDKYQILPLLEIIDEFLASLMKEKPWGFSPAQYLSASFDCHPNYATYLINKNTNHIVGVQKVLSKLPSNNRVSFDKEVIDKLYIESLLETKTPVKGNLNLDNKILLVASGKSVDEYQNLIDKKISNNNYTVIALNHNPKFECDYYLFSNQKRYDEFIFTVPASKVVITSNIFTNAVVPVVLDIKPLAFVNDVFITNVAIAAINYLINNNISIVDIVGLDGYKTNENNYNYQETSIINDNKELVNQNNFISKSLKFLSKKIDIVFLTPTIYTEI